MHSHCCEMNGQLPKRLCSVLPHALPFGLRTSQTWRRPLGQSRSRCVHVLGSLNFLQISCPPGNAFTVMICAPDLVVVPLHSPFFPATASWGKCLREECHRADLLPEESCPDEAFCLYLALGIKILVGLTSCSAWKAESKSVPLPPSMGSSKSSWAPSTRRLFLFSM